MKKVASGWEDAEGRYEQDPRPFHCTCRVAESLWQARLVEHWGTSSLGINAEEVGSAQIVQSLDVSFHHSLSSFYVVYLCF